MNKRQRKKQQKSAWETVMVKRKNGRGSVPLKLHESDVKRVAFSGGEALKHQWEDSYFYYGPYRYMHYGF